MTKEAGRLWDPLELRYGSSGEQTAGMRMGEGVRSGLAGKEKAEVERAAGLGQLLQVLEMAKGARVPPPTRPRNPGPQIFVG